MIQYFLSLKAKLYQRLRLNFKQVQQNFMRFLLKTEHRYVANWSVTELL